MSNLIIFNLITLLLLSLLSFLPTTTATGAIIQTFIDNDDGNIVSDDPDHGWRQFLNGMEKHIDNYCDNNDCKDTDGTTTAYGPFKKEIKYLVRNFACGNDSDITISYKVIFCDTNNYSNKDFIRITIENIDDTIAPNSIQGTKHLIDYTDPSTSYSLNLIPAQCSNWKMSEISDAFTGYDAFAGKAFEVSFKFKLNEDDNKGYVADIEVDCNNKDLDPAPAYEGPESHGSVYCISGLSDSNANGEYNLRTDQWEEEIETNGESAFEKDDPNGVYYFFEQDDTVNNREQWFISKELGNTDAINLIASCNPGPVNGGIHVDEIANYCSSFSIISDGCDSYTIVGEDNNTTSSLLVTFYDNKLLLISLSILSCIIGMITCYCCQLICGHHKNKNYKKVSNKEDIDIDF